MQMLTQSELKAFATFHINKIPEYCIKMLQLHPLPKAPLAFVSLKERKHQATEPFQFLTGVLCSRIKSLIPVASFLLLNDFILSSQG